LQPGVTRLLGTLRGDESILDLGCGNGGLARALSRLGHHGSYLGLDFSLPLLGEAESYPFLFPAHFMQADLVEWNPVIVKSSSPVHWSLITAFAVLHHIPSRDLRLNLLRQAHAVLASEGVFILSHWQFLSNPRLAARIQSWSAIGLAEQDVDANDYLLDWRRGAKALRYVHHFDEAELAELAAASGFGVHETFYSDGVNRKSGLYQIWQKI
jgi:SAM-dependent methyltransferase